MTPQTIFATWRKLAFDVSQPPCILHCVIVYNFLSQLLPNRMSLSLLFDFVFYVHKVQGCREQQNVSVDLWR